MLKKWAWDFNEIHCEYGSWSRVSQGISRLTCWISRTSTRKWAKSEDRALMKSSRVFPGYCISTEIWMDLMISWCFLNVAEILEIVKVKTPRPFYPFPLQRQLSVSRVEKINLFWTGISKQNFKTFNFIRVFFTDNREERQTIDVSGL